MRYVALLLTIVLSTSAHAQIVKRNTGYTGDCDNPTARTDGTPLAVTEIHSVEYYLFPTGETDPTKYALKHVLLGGCRPTHIDTSDVPVGDYRAFGKTIDTDGKPSVMSEGSTEIISIQNASPNAPGRLR
jgi:hypothetical protein